MIYAIGSKLFKAVVVFTMGAYAGPGCCHGHHCDMAEAEAHHSNAKDLADAGEDLDKLDDEDDASTVAPADTEVSDVKETEFAANMSSPDDAPKEHAHGEEQPEMVTEEQFLAAKTAMGLSDEDIDRMVELVEKVPADFKDPSYQDRELAQAFCHHYYTGEDQKDAEGNIREKSRENLLEELRMLVEEEIPQMQKQMEMQQGMGGMGGMEGFDEDMMAQLQAQMAEMQGGMGEEAANEDSAEDEAAPAEEGAAEL